MTVLEAAADYVHRGWHVFPLSARAKVPLAGSQGWKDATTDVPQTWFQHNENIGIATGPSGLVVLDVDAEHGGWETLDALRAERAIPLNTVTAATGHEDGRHFYYAAPEGVEIRLSAGQLGPGLDIRAAGGYVVAPPSIHPSGRAYSWRPGQAPWECELAPFPPALRRKLESKQTPIASVSDGDVIPQSMRNSTLASLAGSMRRRGMGEKAIRAALLAENEARCRPPLSVSDVERIAQSIARYAPEEAQAVAPPPEELRELSGVFEIADIASELEDLYEQGTARGVDTGWPSMSEMYRVALGQWTLVTGIPSHGKSAWVDALMVNLARTQGWRFAVFSPENQPLGRHAAKLARLYVGKPFDRGPHERMTYEELINAEGWLAEHFMFVLPDEERRSVDGVLASMTVAAQRRELQGIVIDPWNELDHSRPAAMTETEFVSVSLRKIRVFARRYQVHVWLVAHPAKLYRDHDGDYPVPRPYDVSGSAHWFNKADNCLAVYREDSDLVQVHVQKVRFDQNGHRGLARFRYDVLTGRYTDAGMAA